MSTRNILLRLIALLISIAFLLMGNGLQGTLLSMRADSEDFDTFMTGLILASYFVGSILGAIVIPKNIETVGHIRVFATAASAVSAIAILHFLFISEWGWLFLRFFTGFCLAGLYIVTESWLNAVTPNDRRGKIFSLYMVVNLGSIAVGQQFINIAPVEMPDLFILSSVLFSIAVIPVGLTRAAAPPAPPTERMSPLAMHKHSPVGTTGLIAAGLASGAFWTMGPIYALAVGMTTGQIAFFLSIIIIGGMCLQTPLGALSDKIDRRYVVFISSAGLGLTAFFMYFTSELADKTAFYVLAFLFGGFLLTLNALSASHINDRISEHDAVPANSTIFLIFSFGAALGPIIVSLLMDMFYPGMLLIYMVVIQLLFLPYVVFRIIKTKAAERSEDFQPLPFRGDPSLLDPRFEYDDSENEK